MRVFQKYGGSQGNGDGKFLIFIYTLLSAKFGNTVAALHGGEYLLECGKRGTAERTRTKEQE